MQFTVTVDLESSSSELSALSVFIHNLACLRNAPPFVEVVENAPIQTVVVSPEVSTPQEEPTEAPKRTRRAKAVMQESEVVQPADTPAEGGVEQAVVKMPEEATTTAPTEAPTPAPTEVANQAPLETSDVDYTEAQVQMEASVVARRVGPAKVHQLISSYNAPRIAALTQEQRNDFMMKLRGLE